MNYSDILDNLPKPVTAEEQYLYALVHSIAGAKYDEPFNKPFYRMDKYWQAFFQVMSLKGGQVNKPSIDSVETSAIQDNAVTLSKLGEDVKEKLLGDNVVGREMLNSELRSRLIGTENILTENIANGSITLEKLSPELKALLNISVGDNNEN